MEALFFTAGGSAYLTPLAALSQVLMPAALRPVPLAPPFLKGLMSLRGRTLPVLDLRERLGLAPRGGFVRGNRILRFEVPWGAEGRDLGLIVDAVLRIETLRPGQRRERVLAAGDGQGLFGGLWEIDREGGLGRHDGLVPELRLDALLDDTELASLGPGLTAAGAAGSDPTGGAGGRVP
jgi:purine-binding chemotaxis protein CheW